MRQKYNQTLRSQVKYSHRNMQGLSIANHILDHIVKEGKNVLLDKKISREKMPIFVNHKMSDLNVDSMAHGGYQYEYNNNNRNRNSMEREKQPRNIGRDRWGHSKSKINKQTKSVVASPNKQKQRSFSYSGLNRSMKSTGFNNLRIDSKIKQKQNQCVKLEEEHRGRIVIDRVKQRQSQRQDAFREVKKKKIMEEYQAKIAQEMRQQQVPLWSMQQQGSLNQQGKKLQAHVKRGSDHKFYFHEGEVVLYRHDQSASKIKLAVENQNYNIQADQFEESQVEIQKISSKSSQHFKKTAAKTVNDHPAFNEHHKIKSARGEVFASSVLKTINLSRISLNETLRNLEVEQFMKRNDLFNNNHSRQTSSIPYMLPKSGTVYTELSTNQVIGDNKNQSQERKSYTFRSETSRNVKSGRRKSHFQPYLGPENQRGNKTERICQQRNTFEEFQSRVEARPIRTADGGRKRPYLSERRPHTSTTKGRITTANEDLAIALLK